MIPCFDRPEDPRINAYWHELLNARENGAGVPDAPEGLEDFAALYAPLLEQRDTPFVIAQLGQSLDGFIATRAGHSHYITGPASLVHLHRLRALCDAVVIGSATAIADNPRLTVRHVAGKNPARIVLDPSGKAPSDLNVFAADGAGCQHLRDNPPPPPRELINDMAGRGYQRILIEGGGVTVSRMIAAGCVDRLHLMIAPLILGNGRRGLALPEVSDLSRAPRPKARRMMVGEDVLFDLDMRADNNV